MTNLFSLYPVLSSLPVKEVEGVLSRARGISLAANTIVFEELNPCVAFPFILSGQLRVVKRSENGRELSLYDVCPGDACVVSAACLLGKEPYNAVGIVKEGCELVMISLDDFETLMSYRVFREFIFGLFAGRILSLMQLIDEVTFGKLDQRLARLLLKRGPIVESSHQKLADELGSVREVISRTLNGFSDRDLIQLSRGRIEVLNIQGLESL